MKRIWLVILFILMLVLIAFALENSASIGISFWFWRASLPVSLLIFSCLTIGFLIGVLVGLPQSFSRKKELTKLKKEKDQLEVTVSKIKKNKSTSEPIDDDLFVKSIVA